MKGVGYLTLENPSFSGLMTGLKEKKMKLIGQALEGTFFKCDCGAVFSVSPEDFTLKVTKTSYVVQNEQTSYEVKALKCTECEKILTEIEVQSRKIHTPVIQIL